MQLNRDGEQKLFRLFGHFSILLVLSYSLLSAKTFENFKKTQNQFISTNKSDVEFRNYLKQRWKSYKILYTKAMYEEPKPQEALKVNGTTIKSVGPKISVAIDKLKQDNIVKKKTTKVKKTKVSDINFDFFGAQLGFNLPDGIKEANFYPEDKKGIINFYDNITSVEYQYLIDDIKEVSKDMNLNDWGIYLLVMKISNSINKNKDSSNLLSWFIFNKLGYRVKIGLSKRHIVLMNYSKKMIYSTPMCRFSGDNFYLISKYASRSHARVYSYEQTYPEAKKALDLSLETLPKFMLKLQTKKVSFKHNGKKYDIEYKYNQNLLDFMATYPQADYETYFNAPLEDITYVTLFESIKKQIDGMKASDAINFVLHFVQKAFKYEVDDKQFSREKVMFAAETLYYDKSDCEDRAILFAYLVKNLFNIGVVGVKYRDHMATAINVPISGDRVKYGQREFVVADPTYINANIGQSMPQYRLVKPEKFIYVKSN